MFGGWTAGLIGTAQYLNSSKIISKCDSGLRCTLFELLIVCILIAKLTTILAFILDIFVYYRDRRHRRHRHNVRNVKAGEDGFMLRGNESGQSHQPDGDEDR